MTATLVRTRAPRTGATMSKRVQRNREQAERNAKICNDWATGRFTQQELAEKYGLKTQGAVSQIVNNPNAHVYK